MASSVESNNRAVQKAKDAADERIREVLRLAVPALQRIGPDCQENRNLVAELCGLPDPGSYITDDDQLVGIDASGNSMVSSQKVKQPADFDKAMGAARLLVATINDAIDRYMAGDDARTAAEVAQYEASAR